MPNLIYASRWTKVMGLLAIVAIPAGIWAYTGGFSSAPAPIDQPIGYVGQDDITNFDLTSGTESLFRPEYDRKTWSGNLHSYPVNAAGQINTSAENWAGGAAGVLATQAQRNIATMNDSGTGVSFTYANVSGISSANITISNNSYTGQQLVDYLRGDNANEDVNGMRVRTAKLGDIIHSRPYFLNDAQDDTVFVGANDGMLHAFNAANGAERWAYIPSMLQSKLKTLAYNTTDSSNPYKHDYFVDGQINVGTVASSSTSNITALYGSLGGGGQGLYALNISSLTAGSDADVAAKALWEITPTAIKSAGAKTTTNSYSHLGYTYGTPQLVKINNGGSALDVLIVGNGYDTAGYAYLYVINAYTGARIAELRAGSGTPTAGSANGIFEPHALDINGDGYVDRVYAADLNGNLWKFDLSSTSPGSWSTASLVFTNTSSQPVTSTLGIARHPNGGFMIEFGTGSTLSGAYGTFNHTTNAWTTAGTGDMATTSPATYWVYGIWDNDAGTVTDSTLVTQALEERTYTSNGVSTRVRRATANSIDWNTKKGWKVALPAGERITGEGSFLENGRFYFNSYNPTVNPTLISGTDTDIYGENWLMELNYLTGGSSNLPFLDLNSDLILDNNDRIPYISGDTIPTGSSVGGPILSPNEKGIPVGKFISTGVQSQPLLVELLKLNTTLINQNPDVIYPATTTVDRGVAGGHFDVDYFYPPTGVCTNLTGGTGSQAVGSVKFSYSSSSKTSANVTNLKITAPNGEVLYSGNPGKVAPKNLDDLLDTMSSANYVMSKNDGGNGDSSTIRITAINPGTAYNGSITVALSVSGSSSNGFTITNLTGGTNASAPAAGNSTTCYRNQHLHEYDDMFDKTGVNFLNPSNSNYLLSKAIPSTSTSFKVLMMNQYLNPAVQIHIGRNDYNPASAVGYVAVKDFQTATGLTIASLPTYTRANVGSLALNMPVDAFSVRNWFGVTPADARVGLMPTSPACVYDGKVDSSGNNASSINADLYNPVIPDTTNSPPTGSGTNGTSTGVRHNGAITVQIIKDTTPEDALELNLAGHPEYGWRLKSSYFYSYVLAEYAIYWHHPARICFGDATTKWYNGSQYGNGFASASSGAWNTTTLMTGTGWKKDMPSDTKASTANSTPAPNSTDPSLGALGANGGTAASATTTVNGNVTTTRITYTDGSYTIIITTTGTDKTTISTTDYTSTGVVVTTKTVTVANASGTTTTGGDESGVTLRTSRVSWRELVRP